MQSKSLKKGLAGLFFSCAIAGRFLSKGIVPALWDCHHHVLKISVSGYFLSSRSMYASLVFESTSFIVTRERRLHAEIPASPFLCGSLLLRYFLTMSKSSNSDGNLILSSSVI